MDRPRGNYPKMQAPPRDNLFSSKKKPAVSAAEANPLEEPEDKPKVNILQRAPKDEESTEEDPFNFTTFDDVLPELPDYTQ